MAKNKCKKIVKAKENQKYLADFTSNNLKEVKEDNGYHILNEELSNNKRIKLKIKSKEDTIINKWSEEELNIFKQLLKLFGTDYTVIRHYIKNKSKKQLITKYNYLSENNLLDINIDNELINKILNKD